MMPEHLPTTPLKHAMTIATSDSGAGAGVQADLKTFAAHRVYGVSVFSAVTAQNTRQVTAMECLSPETVTAQLKAIYDDIPVEAIKIGLLGNAANTMAVTKFLADHYAGVPIILDPVMVSTSGHTFLPPEAIEALKELAALATLVTPNLPEALALSGLEIKSSEDRRRAGEAVLSLGARNVLVKGGHGHGPEADDLLLGREGEVWFRGPRIDTPNTHGTGCTLSSAIAANLALGAGLNEAVGQAKHYVTEGLRHSINLGHGPGPLNHFHQYYRY
ncbi:bifunctional hydroxymethylpyrimidine kinase/phosphomethylpyrimidine kinase [Deltaproteobacteria bacterium OttesenSCG-928-M10]|nr:bifunctional hydroxymethylpyrimidine kinase/phosphomethylpyrimidine kinase [Deltaproteobacteria bacterium OttesenSCG-928-M10]